MEKSILFSPFVDSDFKAQRTRFSINHLSSNNLSIHQSATVDLGLNNLTCRQVDTTSPEPSECSTMKCRYRTRQEGVAYMDVREAELTLHGNAAVGGVSGVGGVVESDEVRMVIT